MHGLIDLFFLAFERKAYIAMAIFQDFSLRESFPVFVFQPLKTGRKDSLKLPSASGF
jgi:hypothetical protein